MELPQINYEYWLADWYESIGRERVYTNKHLRKFIKYTKDVNECTSEIFGLTRASPPDKRTVFRVIDLIYSWGGPSGRMFYFKERGQQSSREELEVSESAYSTYLKGVSRAQNGGVDCIENFRSIKGIGLSYATKHAYFWSLHSKFPLIIIDSKIAGALGYTSIQKLETVSKYEDTIKAFKKKAIEVFKSDDSSKIERALFTFHNYYFLNDNSNWKNVKNKSNHEDFDKAIKLARRLFDKD